MGRDNNLWFITPDTISLSEGIHHITLKYEGYEDTTFIVEINQPDLEFYIQLTEKTSYIDLSSEPSGVEIWDNSGNTNTFTPLTINASQGTYYFTFKLDNYKDTCFNNDTINI